MNPQNSNANTNNTSTGQPMPGQMPPMNQMNQNQPNQSFQQPMQQPTPKPPMDPAKKKKIITWCGVAGGVLILGVIAAVVLTMVFKVNYGESYRAMKDLKPKMASLLQSYNHACVKITENYTSKWTSREDFAEDASNCREMFNDTADLLAKLGETSAIKRDHEISDQFKRVDEGTQTLLANAEGLDEKLKLYEAWHEFALLISKLSYGSSADSNFQAAAQPLINSGNETLKTFAEGWLTRALEISQATRDADNAPIGQWSAKNKIVREKKAELSDWTAENKPNLAEIAKLDFSNREKVATEFAKLREMIAKRYEQNYDPSSDDCTVFLDVVTCSY